MEGWHARLILKGAELSFAVKEPVKSLLCSNVMLNCCQSQSVPRSNLRLLQIRCFKVMTKIKKGEAACFLRLVHNGAYFVSISVIHLKSDSVKINDKINKGLNNILTFYY